MAKKFNRSRVPVPKTWLQKILERPIVYDLMLAWFALFGSVAAATRAFVGSSWWDVAAGFLYLVGVSGVMLFAGRKFYVQWGKHEEEESVIDLEGCLVVLHTQLMQALSEADQRKVRIRVTIHVPDGPDKLVQATNYIGGDGEPGGIGRVFSRTAGIIGLAVKEKKCITASRKTEDYREYLQDLEQNWGFTASEARQRDPAAMSWVAVTIGDPIDCVLYSDSTVRGFYDDARVLQLVSGVSVAIAKFLDLRY